MLVKVEPCDSGGSFEAAIVPRIRQALQEPSRLQDISIWCKDGGVVKTSSVLLAAISPWLRSLLEDVGGKEGDGLILPSISTSDLNNYIDSCLNMAPLSSENKDLVLAVHSILVPDTWHPERDTGRVKVEVDNHGPTLEGSGNVQSMELEEDAGHHHHQDPLDTKPASQDSSKPNKVEPYRCRYDSSCSVAFRSVKVRTEHERAKHAALYVPVTDQPAYNLGKGPTTCRTCTFSSEDGAQFLEHLRKHNVESFTCDCPNAALELSAEGGDQTWNFLAKEKHIRVEHQGWMGCKEPNKETGQECLFVTESKKEIVEHIDKNHKEKKKKKDNENAGKKFLCPDCGKEFPHKTKNGNTGKAELEKHQFWHKVEAWNCECPDVPRLTTRLGQVRQRNIDWKYKERHIRVQHEGWLPCEIENCLVSCESQENLEEHMTKHTKKYVCDSCGFRADDSNKLYYHKQVTHEAVMVPCPDCGKMFKDRYLKLHQRKVHNAAACEICGVVVKNVKHHMQGVHMADSDKRFHCKDCGKGFMCRVTMDNHRMNMHIKAQPYQCRYGCENRYNDTSNRSAHERRRHGAVWTPENAKLQQKYV